MDQSIEDKRYQERISMIKCRYGILKIVWNLSGLYIGRMSGAAARTRDLKK